MTWTLEETWRITKPAVTSREGVVASQHYEASAVGAEVLKAGGNAVDAAVATSFALGVVEPWMSGLGGCGYMMVLDAEGGDCHAVDFHTRAPLALDPADYPVEEEGGADDDLFGWPRVKDDRNVQGPLSIAVPTQAAGMAAALERFGTMPLSQVLAPAIDLAKRGLKVDWHTTLRIALEARGLAAYKTSREHFLPDGLPVASVEQDNLAILENEALVASLERLRDAGTQDFYHGDLARLLVADLEEAGSRVGLEDLQRCEATIAPALSDTYRGAGINVPPGLNAGPTLIDALSRLAASWSCQETAPGAAGFEAWADTLFAAYRHRLATMGWAEGKGSTTHLSVVDRNGNMVALTQTLLSVFGSRVMLPRTGLLMNNGVMWFDPRPGRPNSMAPGRQPLSNMCPTIVTGSPAGNVALGASGGRRIFPAIFQLVSLLVDYGMTLEEAYMTPRIDVSGGDLVTVDTRLDEEIREALAARWPTVEMPPSVISSYACPNTVQDLDGMKQGAAFVTSPSSAVAAA